MKLNLRAIYIGIVAALVSSCGLQEPGSELNSNIDRRPIGATWHYTYLETAEDVLAALRASFRKDYPIQGGIANVDVYSIPEIKKNRPSWRIEGSYDNERVEMGVHSVHTHPGLHVSGPVGPNVYLTYTIFDAEEVALKPKGPRKFAAT